MPKSESFRTPLRWAALMMVLAWPAAGCATNKGGERRPAPTSSERMRDSAPERLADLPAVDRESSPENTERRFGIEAERARREEAGKRAADQRARVEPEPSAPPR